MSQEVLPSLGTPSLPCLLPTPTSPRDGICWQVRQLYGDTGLPGRFLLQGEEARPAGDEGAGLGKGLTWLTQLRLARGARGAVDVVVGETDYGSFAILYLERARQLSVKLYGTSTQEPGLHTPRATQVELGKPSWTHGPSSDFPCLRWGQRGDREGRGSQPQAHSPAPRGPCPHQPAGARSPVFRSPLAPRKGFSPERV